MNDLEAATARFRAMGFDVLDGGVHPGVGTANRVIPLGTQYLELLGVVSPELAREASTAVRCCAPSPTAIGWSAGRCVPTRSIRSPPMGLTWNPASGCDPMACADLARRGVVVGAGRFDDTVFHAMGPRRAVSRADAGESSQRRANRSSALDRAARPHCLSAMGGRGDAPLRLETGRPPGLVSVDVLTDGGELIVTGERFVAPVTGRPAASRRSPRSARVNTVSSRS